MKKPKRYYAVGVVETEAEITGGFGFLTQSIKLNWVDGMNGVLPVFSNKKKAQKYVNSRYGKEVQLITFEAVEEK